MKLVSFLPDNRELGDRLAPLVRCAGLDLTCVEEERHLVSGPGEKVVVLCDEGGLASIGRARASGFVCETILFMRTPLQRLLAHLHGTHGPDHSVSDFVAMPGGSPDECDVAAVLARVGSGRTVTLESALPAADMDAAHVIRDAPDKLRTLEEILRTVEGFGTDSHEQLYREYARRMAQLVDELVLNAIFNANPRLREADRSAPFQLEAREEVTVRWRAQGNRFGVSVRDPFGALERDTVLRYLGESHEEPDFVDERSAGLGLRIVFDRLHKFVINVDRGASTELLCFAHFEKKLKEFDARQRSLSFFVRGGGAR